MNHLWVWLVIAATLAAPVWWILKELGYVTWCPIRSFLVQSAATYTRFFGR